MRILLFDIRKIENLGGQIMHTDFESIVISEEVLEKRISELANQINRDYEGKELMLLCILKGGVYFMTDLSKKITIPMEVDFMAVSSYGNSTKSSGVVRIIKDLERSIEGKDILIVEDIVDSGLTLNYLKDNLMHRNPKSIHICTLLERKERDKSIIDVEYVGFEVDDGFFVGYGLDYAEKYRNIPYIGILKPEIYS